MDPTCDICGVEFRPDEEVIVLPIKKVIYSARGWSLTHAQLGERLVHEACLLHRLRTLT